MLLPDRVTPGGVIVRALQGAITSARGAVRVDQGGGDVRVTEEFLDLADVGARLEKVGGKGVAEGMAGRVFGNAGLADRAGDFALDDVRVDVRAHQGAYAGVDTEAAARGIARAAWLPLRVQFRRRRLSPRRR